jgi:hypothetical protein
MRAQWPHLLASFFSLSILVEPLTVRADPADEKAAAQVLFDEARALVERGDFAGACPKFAESQRIDPGLGTMLWLADCYENSGQTASAWAAFEAAAGTAAVRHDDREKVARARAGGLEPKLVRLKIDVPRVASGGLAILRDGVLLGAAEWGVAVPVDPGRHTIAATAPGHLRWSASVLVSQTDAVKEVVVPVLDPDPNAARGALEPAARASEPAVGSKPTVSPLSPLSKPQGTFQRQAGFAVGGVGIAAILAGAFFSLRAKAMYDESNDGTAPHCLPDNECDAAGKTFRSEASSLATVATIAMSAGLVGAVGGAVLYFTAPSAFPQAVAFAPGASGGSVDVRWGW